MSSSGTGTYLVLMGLLLPALAGCGAAGLIQKNTAAIGETTAVMGKMAGVLESSNASMSKMAGDLESLSSLGGPMKELASLGPEMDRLSSGMTRLEERMAAMEESLGRAEGPMRDVARLDESMKKVAELRPVMRDVAALDESMKKVAELREPMEDLAALGPSTKALADVGRGASAFSPARAAGYGLGLLAAWGGVTFLGVYWGIRAGTRRARGAERGEGERGASRDDEPPPSRVRPTLGGARDKVESRETGEEQAPESGFRRAFGTDKREEGDQGGAGPAAR